MNAEDAEMKDAVAVIRDITVENREEGRHLEVHEERTR